MTITQLESFIKIAETGNFTSAANSLGYAQSTVTTQIKQLEEELDSLLFERLGKTIVLTPAGERLLLYAEQLLQLEREIRIEVPESADPAGVLKIGISESHCYDRLPRILMQFKEKFPKVETQLTFVTHDTFPELLKKGELDLVYTLNPLMEDENLKLLHKQEESLGFYASPNHRLAEKKTVKEEDLKGEAMLLTGPNCSFRHMLLKDLEKHGITPKIALGTTNKGILKQFAANGMGVAFIPDMTAEEELAAETLVRLPWKGAEFPIYSQVFVHRDKSSNKAVDALVKIIEEAL